MENDNAPRLKGVIIKHGGKMIALLLTCLIMELFLVLILRSEQVFEPILIIALTANIAITIMFLVWVLKHKIILQGEKIYLYKYNKVYELDMKDCQGVFFDVKKYYGIRTFTLKVMFSDNSFKAQDKMENFDILCKYLQNNVPFSKITGVEKMKYYLDLVHIKRQ